MKKILSAGIVPVLSESLNDGEPLYLVLRAFNYWDFPKGIVEDDEDPMSAALRELSEETGLKGAEFLWGNDFHETEPYGNNKVARYYLASVSERNVRFIRNPVSGIYEHHGYKWCSFDEAKELLVKRVGLVLSWARDQIGRF